MNQQDIAQFNQAVVLAQSGQKQQAYFLLRSLVVTNPNEPNLYLWLTFTTSDLAEAERNINWISTLDPANSNLPLARNWLASQRSQLPPVPQPQQPPPGQLPQERTTFQIVSRFLVFFFLCMALVGGTIYYGEKLIKDTADTAYRNIDKSLTAERAERVSDEAVKQIQTIRLFEWIIPVAAVILSTAYVMRDADRRRLKNGVAWSAGTLLFWIIVFPLYMAFY